MSIPADAPAAVTIGRSRCSITRPGVECPAGGQIGIAAQWVVAFRPSNSPAAPSTREPVQTGVVKVLLAHAPAPSRVPARRTAPCACPRRGRRSYRGSTGLLECAVDDQAELSVAARVGARPPDARYANSPRPGLSSATVCPGAGEPSGSTARAVGSRPRPCGNTFE
jgi:hypothetical protein